jgi:2-polyprenyl-3-methyl-5-hydroxy-6-metoxy-1,4-benzoquinol methylase
MNYMGVDFTGKEIYRCHSCDHVSTPFAEIADEEALYDDPEYFADWGCNVEFDYDRFDPNIIRQTHNYVDFIEKYAPGKSLLDVGTGHGVLPFVARSRGYEVEGTDLSKYICENLPRKHGFVVRRGRLEEIEFARTYDVVSMLHILEHTRSPVSTLNKCRELLNPGGYVVIVVPNFNSLDSRLKNALSRLKLKRRAYKHLALGHHNHVFSLKSLTILGDQCGFRLIHQETRQPVWSAGGFNHLLELTGLATWCWVVFRKET